MKLPSFQVWKNALLGMNSNAKELKQLARIIFLGLRDAFKFRYRAIPRWKSTQ